jgi:CRISPR/Cas system-associated endonuclease Cas1
MWEHHEQRVDSELLVFHNHPYNPLNFLFDNVPLASRTDRIFLETRALIAPQLVRLILDQGRILFYLGENGFVKQFRLPSLVALLSRQSGVDSK